MVSAKAFLLSTFLTIASVVSAQEVSVSRLWNSLDSGPYAVGFNVIYAYDQSRTWASETATIGRPVRISLWYPAIHRRSASFMRYRSYVHFNTKDQVIEKLNKLKRQLVVWEELSSDRFPDNHVDATIMRNLVTIKETIYVERSPDVVWDFTQNFALRPKWEPSIKSASLIHETPFRLYEVESGWNMKMKLRYKVSDKPNLTTLAMTDIRSFLFCGGGGSWKYASIGKGTMWTRVDSLVLKRPFCNTVLRPIVFYQLRLKVRHAMVTAKKMMEV